MKNLKQGQVALIILLVMVVVLTIGLSLLSHSVTDISISKDEEESLRAFSAAEAGIERVLQTSWDSLNAFSSPQPVIINPDTTALVVANPIKTDISQLLAQYEFMTVDLAGAINANQLILSWNQPAALEVIVYKNDGTVSQRIALTSAAGSICNDSGFTTAVGSFTINVTSNDVLIRIRVVCVGTGGNPLVTLTPAGGGQFAPQRYEITSRSSVGSTAESKTSALQVTRGLPELAPIFDYVLFSGADITTN